MGYFPRLPSDPLDLHQHRRTRDSPRFEAVGPASGERGGCSLRRWGGARLGSWLQACPGSLRPSPIPCPSLRMGPSYLLETTRPTPGVHPDLRTQNHSGCRQKPSANLLSVLKPGCEPYLARAPGGEGKLKAHSGPGLGVLPWAGVMNHGSHLLPSGVESQHPFALN